MYSYMGKILRVDLTNGEVTKETVNEAVFRKYIGGRGLGVKILFDELRPGIDPLGPENKLVIALGAITGIPFPGNSGLVVMAKSPLTGIWGEATAKGFFGPELRYAGYDAIVFEGVSDKPVYLFIQDDTVEIRNAEHLWGKPTRETQRVLKKELGDERYKICVIGIAGENLVRYASVLFDLNHVAGRTGMGAVLGSKKVKAIAVRGTKKPSYAREGELVDIIMKSLETKEALSGPLWPDTLYVYGSMTDLEYWQETGRLPTMNFKRCLFPDYDKISATTIKMSPYVKRHVTCPYCNVGCNRTIEADHPYKVDPDYAMPEYESVAALGSLCMNSDLLSVMKAIELCNKYAMDTMSTGGVIAFAMECYENGILTKEDTDGIDLTWGNPDAVVQLVEKIAKREGIGDLLAEGSRRVAEKLGGNAREYAMHVKGMELPLHEVRGMKGHGLAYATSNRGACHLQVETDDMFEDNLQPEIGITEEAFPKKVRNRSYTGPEKLRLNKIVGDLFAVFDSLIVCKWTAYPCGGTRTKTLVDLIKAATGWDISIEELMKTGDRIFNLCRVFNVREGITRKDDCLPKRFFEPLPEGPLKGVSFTNEEFNMMLDYLYEFRGWDMNGIPTKEKLVELGLNHAVDEYTRLGIIPQP